MQVTDASGRLRDLILQHDRSLTDLLKCVQRKTAIITVDFCVVLLN